MLELAVPVSYSELLKFLVALLGPRTYSRCEQVRVALLVPAGTEQALIIETVDYQSGTRFVMCLFGDLEILANYYGPEIKVGVVKDAASYGPRFDQVLTRPLRIPLEEAMPPIDRLAVWIKNESAQDVMCDIEIPVLGMTVDLWRNLAWPLLVKAREELEVVVNVS